MLNFEELVEQFAPRLYRLAYLYAGDRHLAEDVLQEALASAYQHLKTICNPEPWLVRAVINRARNVWRSRRRHPEAPLLMETLFTCPKHASPRRGSPNPLQQRG